ncbi:MAG: type III-B CRISPR module-associated protein Cmr5 [Verrucomicrobiae bacterium]|nr:type III-B CRISPR module-associated protein Cmr5 [Verrucomicrobiae bacterium]
MNLDQIRATNALRERQNIERGQEGGDAISGFPATIQNCGLLAALAYAVEQKQDRRTNQLVRKHPGEFSIAEAVARHLNHLRIVDAQNADALVNELAQASAPKFRRANAEALAYINYLKRFVVPGHERRRD